MRLKRIVAKINSQNLEQNTRLQRKQCQIDIRLYPDDTVNTMSKTWP